MAHSSANMYGVSGGARMNPGVLRSACTTLTRVATFGQAYMRAVVCVPDTL